MAVGGRRAAVVRLALRRVPLLLLFAPLAACVGQATGEPCFATTGERDYHPEVLLKPPPEARRGSTVEVRFSGGYYGVRPQCERFGSEDRYTYPTLAELREISRPVEIFLGQTPIASADCTYDCSLVVAIPETTPIGDSLLIVRLSPYASQHLEFTITITE